MPTDASMTERSPSPLWPLVEKSLDEAEFLWRRWQGMLSTHVYGLEGVSFWVEERLLGAIDGLHVGGDLAIDRLLIPGLGAEDHYRAAVAAHVLATAGDLRGIPAVVAAFREADDEKLLALEHGLESVRSKAFFAALDEALVTAAPEHLASSLRMRAFQQRDPGPDAARYLESSDAGQQIAALRAIRHTTAISGAVAIERHLGAEHPAVRDVAIETGLIRGMSTAWARCCELASSPKPDAGRALLLVALLAPASEQTGLFAAAADETLRNQALFALGFVGTRAAAELCIEAMAAGASAQLAAEAFGAITGLDLVTERLVGDKPTPEREEPIPFEEEDLDANLVPTPEDLLPWPDVGGVIRWWNAHRKGFADGERYLKGAPLDLNALQRALLEGPMRRRHAIALELAIRSGGRYQVETRAFSAPQRRQMETFELLGGAGMRRSRLQKSFSPA